MIAAATDIALVVTRDGIIQDLSFRRAGPWLAQYRSWVGRPWVETVAKDSVSKVEALLHEAFGPHSVRAREINHRAEGMPDLPIWYSAVSLGDKDRILAVGRDLRAVASLQQQLVSAQQSMEREYARLRRAETRYRLLFHIASEAVLVVDAESNRVVEANPAAAELLKDSPRGLGGRELASFFDGTDWPELKSMLDGARVTGQAEYELSVRLADGRPVTASASLFRQDGAALVLVQLTAEGEPRPSRRGAQVIEAIEGLPDGFVVVDVDGRVMMANSAFLDLVQMATEEQVRRQPIERWLGRAGVDLNIIMANLREHGTIRNFSTTVRGEHGSNEKADLSGVAAIDDDQPCYAFVIRPLTVASRSASPLEGGLPNSVDQLTDLVGRVSLKEIVRETTETIERLCIEAALEVSGNNRASAAQILGLSRQGLYTKLRRHALGESETEEGD